MIVTPAGIVSSYHAGLAAAAAALVLGELEGIESAQVLDLNAVTLDAVSLAHAA